MRIFGDPGSRRRRLVLALAVYLVSTAVYVACAAPGRLTRHTPFNHYALLADGWAHGRLDLGRPPPDYTQRNDFVDWHGRWFVSFPPFPGVLLFPFEKLAGSPERLPDGLIWLLLAGVGPAGLFLTLEKLRRRGYSECSQTVNLLLTGLFAFGTVYFFTAEQGTVWFSAHVVAVALTMFYALVAIDAEHPAMAGTLIGLAFATRGPPAALGAAFFVFEAIRVSAGVAALSTGNGPRTLARALDWRRLARLLGVYAIPIVAIVGVTLWHNRARFGTVLEFGHGLLTIQWRFRIERWGLFSYHYLARNLGIALTSLPFVTRARPHFQINSHGLALWLTTPAYLWLLWPRRTSYLWWSLVATVALVAGLDLLYHNSGWLQFGYRFSNDYAVYLFLLLAIGNFRFGRLFWSLAVVAVAVNTFGALTFDRAPQFYYTDNSQQIIYQPD
jgi:hypothetical protein